MVGIGVVVVGLIAALLAVLIVSDSSESPSGNIRLRLDDEGRGHVAAGSPITYENIPPASGPHYLVPAPYGVYRDEAAEGAWVHSLEHGAIVLLYRCDVDCNEVVPTMETIYRTLPVGAFGEVKFLATPYRGLVPKYMLVAWRWQEQMEYLDDHRIRLFYADYVDRGPETAP